MVTNVAQQGNCFIFNSEYNFEDPIMYEETKEGYHTTGQNRISTLTGPSFGLNLIINLDQLNYMEGEITKEVNYFFESFKIWKDYKTSLHVQ